MNSAKKIVSRQEKETKSVPVSVPGKNKWEAAAGSAEEIRR